MASLLPQLFLDSGAGLTPSDGALLHFNVVGSGTDKDTYTTAAATVANANPVVAGPKGVFPPIYITGSYDWVLQDKNAVQQNTGTVDELQTAGSAVVKNFATLAAAVADLNIVIGSQVSTLGYTTAGDGGGGLYEAVAAGTGTVDGGSFINSNPSGSFQLKLITTKVSALNWGVLKDGTVAQQVKMQAAQDYAEANTGGDVFYAAGTYSYAAPITIADFGSVSGVGYKSRLTPLGCDGFTFAASGALAGRAPFKDIWVDGDATAGTICFDVKVDATAATRVSGLLFDNVYVDGFEIAWDLGGTWHTTIRHCHAYAVWKAVHLIDRNIQTIIDGCTFSISGATTGTGVSTGIHQELGATYRSEDLQVLNSLALGFAHGANIENCLYTNIDGCDFDQITDIGVQLVTVNGGCGLKNSWINLAPAGATKGVNMPDLGSANDNQITIDNNYINRTVLGTTSSHLGIYAGVNQKNVSIINNNIVSFYDAISLNSDDTVVTGNTDVLTVNSSIIWSDFADNTYVAFNKFSGLLTRGAAKPHINFGPNTGVLTQRHFQAEMTASATSTVYTFAALGLPDGMANGSWNAQIGPIATLDVGNAWAEVTQTGITIRITSNPYASNVSYSIALTAF